MNECSLLFTGDLMSQIPLNHACMTADGYDYSPVFAPVRDALADADYLVGNLEMPLAGKARKYSYERYIFNTPIQYAQAVKDAGFDLVSLANNHCMDRDLGGLYMTIENLEKIGLPSIGTARSPRERERCCIADLNGIRIGFLAYTYGINSQHHFMYLPEGTEYAVNLIQPAENLEGAINLLEPETVAEHTKRLYQEPSDVYDRVIAPYYTRLEGDMKRLRENGAELIVMLLHSGGQYDDEPDAYTREVVGRLCGMGIDAVICNHQHVLHPFEAVSGKPVAWSLGNFVHCDYMTPHPKMSPYSALLRLTARRIDGKARFVRASAMLTKSVANDRHISQVHTLRGLMEKSAGDALKKLECDGRHYLNLLSGVADASRDPGAELVLWEKT